MEFIVRLIIGLMIYSCYSFDVLILFFRMIQLYAKEYLWEDIMLSVRKICFNAELPVKKTSLIKQINSGRNPETKKDIHTKHKDIFER